MIRPLRRVHRALFLVLLPVLPASLGWTLLHRAPADAPAPPAAEIDAPRLAFTAGAAGAVRLHVDLPPDVPEVLAYVDGGDAAVPGASARLVGSVPVPGGDFALPPDARGAVLLYSPVLRRTLARAALPASAPGPAP